jgi:hypothetical protein
MTRNKLFFGSLCALVLVGSLCVVAAKGQGVPYRMSDREVGRIMRQLKQDSNRFRKSLDSSLDRSRLDGTNREDDINAFIKEFAQETDRLQDHFKERKSASADVETVLDRAARIDQFMRRHPLRERAQRDWNRVRQDLRRLSDAYNVTWRWW